MTPSERAARARVAKEALNNPAVIEALKQLQVDAVEIWAATDLSETVKRETTYFQMLGAKQVHQQLINWSRETERTGDK
jgi:hypothetical protein